MILVSRTLSDGRQTRNPEPRQTEGHPTIGGVVQWLRVVCFPQLTIQVAEGRVDVFRLYHLGDGACCEAPSLRASDSEAQSKILSVIIIIQAPAIRTRNPQCGHCGTHRYGDCELAAHNGEWVSGYRGHKMRPAT